MTPEAFIQAFHEAFAANTQLPIAFGFSDEPLAQERIPYFVSNIELYQQTFNRDKE